MKGETNKLAALPSLTEAQRLGAEALKREGFALDGADGAVVRIKRGNDYRIVRLDGSVRRGLGAKR